MIFYKEFYFIYLQNLMKEIFIGVCFKGNFRNLIMFDFYFPVVILIWMSLTFSWYKFL